MAKTLNPNPAILNLERIIPDGNAVTIVASSKQALVACPSCGKCASRVHSRYQRTVADLPWQGIAARFILTLRKFFCDNKECERRIFAERLPEVVQRYARKTVRLADALTELAFLVGGEAAARIARTFGLAISPDALLNAVKRAPVSALPTPRVLGIDDFAFRKGRIYGTILIDQERRCPVDLLPDRDAESVTAWLRNHPGVQIISRDRGKCYQEGATQGAPDATQVADRWHLLKNLGDTLEMALRRHHKQLAEASRQHKDSHPPPPLPDPPPVAPEKVPRRTDKDKAVRHEAQEARHNQIRRWHEEGFSVSAIARKAGMSRMTVRKYLKSSTCPFYSTRRPSPRLLAPFEEYLKQRWREGCHSAVALHEEIARRGFRGKYTVVKEYLHQFRSIPNPGQDGHSRPRSPDRTPAASSVRWWLLGHFSRSGEEADWQRGFVERLVSVCPEMKHLQDLALAFVSLVRGRREGELSAWLEKASGCSAWELRGFAKGLVQDEAAVRAALSQEWSNGPVEGQVNRLKFLKRSMYGRAGFDLLRARVLHRVAA